MAWTDQQIAEIVKAFYIDGFSAAQIAPRYGVSRNAIIGVAHRHRQKAGHVPKARPPAKPRQPRAPRDSRPKRAFNPHSVFSKTRAPLPAQVPVAVTPRSVPLLQVGVAECRFAVTPHEADAAAHLFCGLPTGDRDTPYCPHHARRATRQAA